MHEIFGDEVPVSSLKGHIGHTLGACGALEAWITIEMMRARWFAPTLNLDAVDPRCAPLNYIQHGCRELEAEYVVSNNFAFGGVNTPICLLGHTHVPMVFEAPPANDSKGELAAHDVVAYVTPDGEPIALAQDRRYICNPGSVGQPRDADPRASFAVLDLDQRTFTVHRTGYDIDAAQLATQQAGLPTVLADRLAIGA